MNAIIQTKPKVDYNLNTRLTDRVLLQAGDKWMANSHGEAWVVIGTVVVYETGVNKAPRILGHFYVESEMFMLAEYEDRAREIAQKMHECIRQKLIAGYFGKDINTVAEKFTV